mmetsp:Transcript_44493/g.107726  ORF Transcript_44493/g.107726 Transcript_44493/m.107726 type:complete len:557 (-) Transcript_44493:2477-4147(-)
MPSPTSRFRQRPIPTNQDDVDCNNNDETDSKLRIRKSTTTGAKTLLFYAAGVFFVYHMLSWIYFTIQQTPGETFELRVGNDRLEAAYNLAKREVYENIVEGPDKRDLEDGEKSHFVAGYGWAQLWTRDSSYAIEQGGGLLAPDASLNSLIKCTSEVVLDNTTQAEDTVWYQDECGHFRGWPYLSDAIVGARGAWFVFLYTGNTTFLNFAFNVTVNSLRRGESDVFRDGLFWGCSSFMESNSGYPLKFRNNGPLVGQTKALSTNMLYYNGYKLAVSMAKVLLKENPLKDTNSRYLTDETIQDLIKKGNDLKQSIRNRFWMEDKGHYAYVIDENDEFIPQMEGLGTALVLLSDDFEDSNQRVRSILNNTHSTDIGIPCLWPQFDHGNVPMSKPWVYERYHNGRIWPFVVGYYAVAAARYGRMDILAQQILSMIELSETQNTFAEFYELDKSFPERQKRQLWSDTGFLTMIYHGLFGMRFLADGILFAPSRPHPGTFLETQKVVSLLNVRYRKATIDIHVDGYGNRLSSFRINGVEEPSRILKASSKGKFVIDIKMTSS